MKIADQPQLVVILIAAITAVDLLIGIFINKKIFHYNKKGIIVIALILSVSLSLFLYLICLPFGYAALAFLIIFVYCIFNYYSIMGLHKVLFSNKTQSKLWLFYMC